MKNRINIITKILHVLLIISSVLFTVIASLKDKANNSNAIHLYLILYGLVFLPPIVFNIITYYLRPRENRTMIGFGEILQIIVAINVLLILNRFGYFPNDKELYGPWVIMLVVDLCYAAVCKYHGRKEKQKGTDQ